MIKKLSKNLTFVQGRFSIKRVAVFVLLFAAIGSYFVYKDFAATSTVPGDINNDSIVNLQDLSILISNFSKPVAQASNPGADINSDGTVTINDLSVLLSNYGKSGTTTTATPASAYGAVPIPAGLFTADWSTPLAPDRPLHASSATWAANLRTQMYWPTGGPSGYYMGFADTTCGHPLYVVPADTPLTVVRVRNAAPNGVAGPELDAALQKGVPLPSGWHVNNCSGDNQVAVLQPSTGKYWDLQSVTTSDQNFGGAPSVAWGGYMNNVLTNPGHFQNIWNAQWVFSQRNNWGASATSLPLMAGVITKEDVESGVIKHAIAMAVGQADCTVFLYPAQRHDCRTTATPVPEGARFRYPAAVDVDAYVAKFHSATTLTLEQDAAARRFLRMVIVAGRDYGFIVSDQTGGGPALYFREYSVTDGAVKWANIRPGWPVVSPYEYMRSMPWDQAQVVVPQ